MNGILLRLYMHENRRHEHLLAYEWLLEHARKLGIEGGTAFRAVAGFGRHGVLHEEHFFELAADLPVVVEFALNEGAAARLLDSVRAAGLRVTFVRIPMSYGVTTETA